MVFNSILNLIQDNYEGVYKFLCRIFYENFDDLSLDECQLIFSAIEKVRMIENPVFEDFISHFDCNGRLFNVLNELRADGEYGIFTNEKDVNLVELDGALMVLTSDYFDIFNNSYINNSLKDEEKKDSGDVNKSSGTSSFFNVFQEQAV